MLTVSRLARHCGLSRSTVLYYESIGLLKPARRSAGNYRVYTDRDAARLRRIRLWRESGLTLEDIRSMLDQPDSNAAAILKRRLEELSAEVERLRGHQHAIAALLGQSAKFRRPEVVTKDKLVSIMRSAGLSEADMHRFHAEFEKTAPQEHQEFLEFLHIPAGEVKAIRESSRKG